MTFEKGPTTKSKYADIQLHLENGILEAIQEGNLNRALDLYKKIIKIYLDIDIGNKCKLRSIKNHIICLTTLIDKTSYKFFLNTNIAHKEYFFNKIESCRSVNCVIQIGQQIIKKYCKTIADNCCSNNKKIIEKAILYIYDNFSRDIKLHDVCNYVHVSSSYFCSIFKKSTGMCFSRYLNRVRIEKSKELLRQSKMSILEIALEVGFNSQSYFTKMFKKITGVTPKDFRKNYLVSFLKK
ncbi:helix-turn-helix transcriptional regulator [Thermosipho ferrireducens]|uniref:Helix-turn-helix transcriptional regulator n=1 Tax=Thermosipho ferrireducens TaxID=2571116 RepID=A0ABX7S4V5_9BACT|nr:AraC family transcriptional regulator [Thermosipho ferrireducens]QTA37528.1 helix-turn-helix transcriptional regulator [Thermosipho ferrireducens]